MREKKREKISIIIIMLSGFVVYFIDVIVNLFFILFNFILRILQYSKMRRYKKKIIKVKCERLGVEGSLKLQEDICLRILSIELFGLNKSKYSKDWVYK